MHSTAWLKISSMIACATWIYLKRMTLRKMLPKADGVPVIVPSQKKYCPFMTMPDLTVFKITFRMISFPTLLMCLPQGNCFWNWLQTVWM